ncbi:metallophosphoesterase [Amaricoccus tamworthensis]|uniref:metallophosphoesterase n=1 Tax=Amaricoccus tamworthensis TaxID=57002 RepID=UPI003C7ED9E8
MPKFIVVSDLHLVPDPEELSCTLNPAKRLHQAVDHINETHPDAAFCVFAGDLADDAARGAYDVLKGGTDRLAMPSYPTMGNHDDRALFAEVYPQHVNEETGRIDHVLDLDGCRVIVLDTLKVGDDAGEMSDVQFEWLDARLAEVRETPVVVVSHHGIANVGTPLDFISFTQKERLAEILTRYGNVRQIISGHVHLSTAGVWLGIPFTTIAGSHYTIHPSLKGPIPDIPRRAGPAQMAVVLTSPEGIVVHHENFVDGNDLLPAEFFRWDPDN